MARLTEGQIECLLLVDRHYSSKEIASKLGISPHTVDQRIRGALDKLGVERQGRRCAHGRGRAFRRSPHISAFDTSIAVHRPGRPAGQEDGTVRTQIRHADRAGGAESPGYLTEQSPDGRGSPLQLPFATRSHPSNEMSVGLRLVWIVLIAMGATFSAGMYLAGLESLSRMISG